MMAYIIQLTLKLPSGKNLRGYIQLINGSTELFEQRDFATRFKTRQEAEKIARDTIKEMGSMSNLEFELIAVRARRIL
jgi:hypothetical protein